MKAVVLVFALINLVEGFRKCCDEDEILKRSNDTFKCYKSVNSALRILSNDTGLLASNDEGRCVDNVVDNVYLFDVSNGNISQVDELDVKLQQKCCQADSFYESSTGNCLVQNNTMDLSFLDSNFIEIGSPNCKILEETLDVTGPSCMDRNENGTVIRMKCGNQTEICQKEKCVKKCCSDGYSFVNSSVCTKTGRRGLDLSLWKGRIENVSDPYKILFNSSCGKLTLLELNDTNYNFTMDIKGIFTIVINGYINIDEPLEENSYCIEHITNGTTEGYMFYICSERLEEHWLYIVYPLLLSCVFLPLTIVIYVVLGETKKIFGKVLICYCLVMLCWFSKVVEYMLHRRTVGPAGCYFTALFLSFSKISTFTWLSVLCWDIFRTFGSTKSLAMSVSKKSSVKTMVYYALYALGVPTVLLSMVVFFFIYDNILPRIIQPYLETGNCVFGNKPDSYSAVMFVVIPITIIQTISTILFILTIVYCIRTKREIDRRSGVTSQRKKFQRDRDRLLLVLKLMVIMGATFLFQATANFFNDLYLMGNFIKYLEIVMNCINASQGFWIFIICVCNQRIIKKIMALGVNINRKLSVSKSSVSSGTSSRTTETVDMDGTKKDSVETEEYATSSTS